MEYLSSLFSTQKDDSAEKEEQETRQEQPIMPRHPHNGKLTDFLKSIQTKLTRAQNFLRI